MAGDADSRGGGTAVLVVDDNRDGATTLAKLLNSFGCDARACFDGASALEAVNEFRPDLVFLDIRLPDLPGTEVCSRMRLYEALQNTMFVALTGATDDATVDAVQEVGFDRILTKPVDLDSLLDVLKAAGGASPD